MAGAIFITFDDHCAQYAKDCLSSLEKNYPDHPDVLVYYDGADADVIRFLHTIENARIMPFDFSFMDLSDVELGPVNSPKVYFRYLLWTEAFARYDNIVHLDADIIVLRPFDELFRKKEFFAVIDHTPFGYTLFKREKYRDPQLLEQLAGDNLSGSPENFRMMNAGVFVIPKKYRTRAQFEQLVSITRRYSPFTCFADQSAISLWCHRNDISFSDELEFNFQAAYLCNQSFLFDEQIQNDFATSQIRIFHFTWWKPSTAFYQKFLESAQFLTDVNREYIGRHLVPVPE